MAYKRGDRWVGFYRDAAGKQHTKVKSAGVVCDDLCVIFVLGQALSAGMFTSSVAESVSWPATGRMRQRLSTSRPR